MHAEQEAKASYKTSICYTAVSITFFKIDFILTRLKEKSF